MYKPYRDEVSILSPKTFGFSGGGGCRYFIFA